MENFTKNVIIHKYSDNFKANNVIKVYGKIEQSTYCPLQHNQIPSYDIFKGNNYIFGL